MGQCYQTFLSIIYIFLCKASVSRLEKLAWDKHSNLLRKFINYRRKKFYRIGLRETLLKKFCKLDHFILTAKGSSLQKVRKFILKIVKDWLQLTAVKYRDFICSWNAELQLFN